MEKENNDAVVAFLVRQMQKMNISRESVIKHFGPGQGAALILDGKMRLPTNYVTEFADLLKCDRAELMRLYLRTYTPNTWAAIAEVWPVINARRRG